MAAREPPRLRVRRPTSASAADTGIGLNALRFRRQRDGQRLTRDNAIARFTRTAVKSHFPSRTARACPFEFAVGRHGRTLVGWRGQRPHRRPSAPRARCRASGAASRLRLPAALPWLRVPSQSVLPQPAAAFPPFPALLQPMPPRRSRIGKNSQGVNRQRNVQRLAGGDGVARVGHDALHSQLRIFAC